MGERSVGHNSGFTLDTGGSRFDHGHYYLTKYFILFYFVSFLLLRTSSLLDLKGESASCSLI